MVAGHADDQQAEQPGEQQDGDRQLHFVAPADLVSRPDRLGVVP